MGQPRHQAPSSPRQRSIPALFDALLVRDPYAPMVILRRPQRVRIHNRAAVEHRAVQIQSLWSEQGVPTDARIAVDCKEPMNCLGVLVCVLSTGRQLCAQADADLVVTDRSVRKRAEISHSRSGALLVPSTAPAARFGAVLDHGELLAALDGRPLLDPFLWRCLKALANGRPVIVDAAPRRSDQASVREAA